MGAGVDVAAPAALTFTGGLGAVASWDCVEAVPRCRASAVVTKTSAMAKAESASVRALTCMSPPMPDPWGIAAVGLYGPTGGTLIPVAPPREYTRPFTRTLCPT